MSVDQPDRWTAADQELREADLRDIERRRATGRTNEIGNWPDHQIYNCATGGCDECVPYSASYRCQNGGCGDVAVEGGRCEKHVRRWAA